MSTAEMVGLSLLGLLTGSVLVWFPVLGWFAINIRSDVRAIRALLAANVALAAASGRPVTREGLEDFLGRVGAR